MEEISNNLNEFLADLNIFYRKLQNYHWNITGKNFFVMHSKLEEYYDQINKQIDEVAEHILMIGYQPLGTLKDYIQISKIEEAQNNKICDDDVFNNVLDDFQKLLNKSIKIKSLSDNQSAYATSSFIDTFISDYTKNIWMLNQMLHK